MPKIVPKSIQTCFEQALGLIFRKFLAQFSMEGRVFENFRKKPKIFKVPKKPQKSEYSEFALNRSQKYPNVFWTSYGANFPKIFGPVFHGRSSLRKFSKKSKKNKIPKLHKIVPKSIQTISERVFGAIFPKKFLPSVPWRVESSKIFKKNQKHFKVPKMPKIVPKSIQTCFEQVLGLIFRKFLAHFSMEGRVFEDFQKKSKNFQNSKDAQNRSQKYPNVFWTCFATIFSKKINFAQFSMEARDF